MPVDLRLLGLRKEFTSPEGTVVVAVDDVTLEVEKGAFVTLLGPSGCGKTTLLRMIAGFEQPTAGEVHFGERRVDQLAPNARDTAMVFQSYAIFPHLNVYDNVAFGLRMQRLARAEVEARVGAVLEQVGLGAMARRSPSQLSGGQQQRVALARCIVMHPKLLLFDEPLSNLDAKLREQMRVEIRELQQRLGITSVYVTHDQVEAMAMSDLVVIMNSGRVEQVGTPQEVYARPNSRFVAGFIGDANFLPAVLLDRRSARVGTTVLPLADPCHAPAGSQVTVVARPEAMNMTRSEGAAGPLHGTVKHVTFLGSLARYVVSVEGLPDMQVDAANPAEAGLVPVGAAVTLAPGALHALAPAVEG
ncbi:MAG: ABC transporter ATP-binding protein [Trueperaceae bacterium]|nr:ABC transporter ATP-binding protein [Trueperaceae bacterium]